MISMNAVWDDTIAFIRRESALLIPLALATLLVGDVISTLATPATGEPSSLLMSILLLAAIVWTLLGQLAIVTLVLRPNTSVGEAMMLASRRLPTLLGAALLVGLAATVVLLPAIVGLIRSGVDPAVPETYANMPGWVAFYFLAVGGALIWLSVRLTMLNALIVDRWPGVIAALRASFAMTRGVVARLLLIVLVYVVTAFVLESVVRFVLGSGFALIGQAMASPFVGDVLTALAVGLVTATLSTIAAVFIAMLYRRLSSGT